MSNDALKVAAAERALQFVEPRMKLGLGTGSTAARFVDLLGAEGEGRPRRRLRGDLGSDAGPGRGARHSA